jgi:hypothetical protein
LARMRAYYAEARPMFFAIIRAPYPALRPASVHITRWK